MQGHVVGTIQKRELPSGEDEEGVVTRWVLEISTWDQRTLRCMFGREDHAHAHAERLLRLQDEFLKAVTLAKEASYEFEILDL